MKLLFLMSVFFFVFENENKPMLTGTLQNMSPWSTNTTERHLPHKNASSCMVSCIAWMQKLGRTEL